jgi:CO/xanthine dehydrogenase FAD-binding subunit
MLNPFELLIPSTLHEALAQYAPLGSRCKILAGGTDVLVGMHGGRTYDCLMDIKGLEELKGVSYSPEAGLSIGALTTHRHLERLPLIKELYTALFDGVSQIGAVQTRCRGTIGGNICNAAPSGDSLGPLLVLNARLVLQHMQGIREIPFGEFFTGAKQTVLLPGELLVRILLPPPAERTGSAYTKFTRRKAMDLALLGVAASITVKGGVCQDLRIALSTAAPTVIRAQHAEQYLRGKELTESAIREAGTLASSEASPRSSWRASGEYRRELILSLVPRTIQNALARVKE